MNRTITTPKLVRLTSFATPYTTPILEIGRG
jgi:hypothetical protein